MHRFLDFGCTFTYALSEFPSSTNMLHWLNTLPWLIRWAIAAECVQPFIWCGAKRCVTVLLLFHPECNFKMHHALKDWWRVSHASTSFYRTPSSNARDVFILEWLYRHTHTHTHKQQHLVTCTLPWKCTTCIKQPKASNKGRSSAVKRCCSEYLMPDEVAI